MNLNLDVDIFHWGNIAFRLLLPFFRLELALFPSTAMVCQIRQGKSSEGPLRVGRGLS
jgi:hypothetical protein